MKKLLIILFILPVLVSANQDSIWTEIDTLQTFDDKVLVEATVYSNNKTIETYKAFLFPTSIEISRFRWTNLFNSTYSADSVVYHGEKLTFLESGYWKKENYKNGELTYVEYFNERNQVLTIEEFNEGNEDLNTRGPCGTSIRRYFIGERIKN